MKKRSIIPFIILLFIALILSFVIGRYSLSPIIVLKGLLGFNVSNQAKTIIFNLRLPRIVIAVLLGSGLALSGLVYQGLFQIRLCMRGSCIIHKCVCRIYSA